MRIPDADTFMALLLEILQLHPEGVSEYDLLQHLRGDTRSGLETASEMPQRTWAQIQKERGLTPLLTPEAALVPIPLVPFSGDRPVSPRPAAQFGM